MVPIWILVAVRVLVLAVLGGNAGGVCGSNGAEGADFSGREAVDLWDSVIGSPQISWLVADRLNGKAADLISGLSSGVSNGGTLTGGAAGSVACMAATVSGNSSGGAAGRVVMAGIGCGFGASLPGLVARRGADAASGVTGAAAFPGCKLALGAAVLHAAVLGFAVAEGARRRTGAGAEACAGC